MKYKINHEILVVNDNSKDRTLSILHELEQQIETLVYYTNDGPNGFGYAIRYGLEKFSGDCVAIMMADLSDDPMDLVRFYHRMIEDDVDCVFGSRFIKGGKIIDYPFHKLLINRVANSIIRIFIGTRYNDSTNAFKLYKRNAIEGLKPFLTKHKTNVESNYKVFAGISGHYRKSLWEIIGGNTGFNGAHPIRKGSIFKTHI